LLGISIATLAALLGFIIAQEAEQFARALTDIATGTALLTSLAFGPGWATAWASGAGGMDRFTFGMVFVVQNVGIATAIAVTVLGAAVGVFRYLRDGDGINLTGADNP
jgi:hypothetical protein